MQENEVKEVEEKEPKELEIDEPENVEEVSVKESDSQEHAVDNVNASDLIQQQARQSEYIDKMNALLNKEDISLEDVKMVEYIKSEVLAQLVGVTVFSNNLQADDPRVKAAGALSKHLTNMYTKTELLREKMEKKRLAHLEKMDVADAYFGPNSSRADNRVITDEMLMPNMHQLTLSLKQSSPKMIGALMLVDFLKDPEARLKAMMPDLIKEFDGKTTASEKQTFSKWAENLIGGLVEMKTNRAIMNALSGNKMANTLVGMSNVNDILG